MAGALIDRLQPGPVQAATKATALAWQRLRGDDSEAARHLQDLLARNEAARHARRAYFCGLSLSHRSDFA